MWRTALDIVILLTASHAHARNISPWVGQRVVTRLQTRLKDGNGIVDDGSVLRVL